MTSSAACQPQEQARPSVGSEQTPLLRDESGTGLRSTGGVRQCMNYIVEALVANDKALSYTMLTTVATVPTIIFSSLHMVAFVDMHHLTTQQVASAQGAFVAWSLVGDILAGYASDGYAARVGTRLGFLCAVQIVWVATCFLPFVDLAGNEKGHLGTLYYLCCITIFDACLCLIGGARAALMADITDSEVERVHFKRLNSIFGNIEVAVNLSAYAFWNSSSTGPFLTYLVGVISTSIFFNVWSTSRLRPYVPKDSQAVGKQAEAIAPPLFTFLRSLPKNAWVYMVIVALHQLQSVAWGQFAYLMMDSLLVDMSKTSRVTLMACISAAGGIVALLLTWVVDFAGLYSVFLWNFRFKVAIAAVLLVVAKIVGITQALVCLFMLLNEITMAVVTGFHLVVMTSLMDELAAERIAGGTGHPLASYPHACGPALLMGVSAFFAKPAGALGPIVGTALFTGSVATSASTHLRAFALLSGLPIVAGIGQWLLWGMFFSPRCDPHSAATRTAEHM